MELLTELFWLVILAMLIFYSSHKLHNNGLTFALLHALHYTPCVALFFKDSLTLGVVVTAIGPSILQRQHKVLLTPLSIVTLSHHFLLLLLFLALTTIFLFLPRFWLFPATVFSHCESKTEAIQ